MKRYLYTYRAGLCHGTVTAVSESNIYTPSTSMIEVVLAVSYNYDIRVLVRDISEWHISAFVRPISRLSHVVRFSLVSNWQSHRLSVSVLFPLCLGLLRVLNYQWNGFEYIYHVRSFCVTTIREAIIAIYVCFYLGETLPFEIFWTLNHIVLAGLARGTCPWKGNRFCALCVVISNHTLRLWMTTFWHSIWSRCLDSDSDLDSD